MSWMNVCICVAKRTGSLWLSFVAWLTAALLPIPSTRSSQIPNFFLSGNRYKSYPLWGGGGTALAWGDKLAKQPHLISFSQWLIKGVGENVTHEMWRKMCYRGFPSLIKDRVPRRDNSSSFLFPVVMAGAVAAIVGLWGKGWEKCRVTLVRHCGVWTTATTGLV